MCGRTSDPSLLSRLEGKPIPPLYTRTCRSRVRPETDPGTRGTAGDAEEGGRREEDGASDPTPLPGPNSGCSLFVHTPRPKFPDLTLDGGEVPQGRVPAPSSRTFEGLTRRTSYKN